MFILLADQYEKFVDYVTPKLTTLLTMREKL